ncbi:MAG: beta-N-acetylhexosaminidase [Arenicellales bacterium]|nr:beta-N-acetylhexosaminidase [Arenicellales bacterium]
MTVALPLGPLFIDVKGKELLPEERDKLAHPSVGGVILFARNYESVQQLKALIDSIKKIRTPSLLTAVDQEGGRVQRFKHDFTELPPAKSYGDLYDREQCAGIEAARSAGYVMALELREVDVDFSFAPVLDLALCDSEVIGDRAFHRDPAAVSVLARAFIDGMNKAGMKAVGKHFPGHGAVKEDSHLCLPCDERTWVDVNENDLVPYRALSEVLHGVMTAHVVFPSIDGELPTYSAHWLRSVLRDEIGFKGVVFSDDLSMEGAAIQADPVARVRRALEAGCDMALICNRPDVVDQVLDRMTFAPNRDKTMSVLALKGTQPDKTYSKEALATLATVGSQLA